MSEISSQVSDTGEIYRFGKGLAGNVSLVRGWGEPEKGFVWSEGKCGEISLPAASGTNILSISLWGYIFSGIRSQDLLIFINGRMCGYFEIGGKTVIRLQYLNDRAEPKLDLNFYIPSAKSPQEVEGVADKRCLGIALSLVQVSAEPNRETNLSAS